MKKLLNDEITNYKTQINDLIKKSTQNSNDRNNDYFNNSGYDVKEYLDKIKSLTNSNDMLKKDHIELQATFDQYMSNFNELQDAYDIL